MSYEYDGFLSNILIISPNNYIIMYLIFWISITSFKVNNLNLEENFNLMFQYSEFKKHIYF